MLDPIRAASAPAKASPMQIVKVTSARPVPIPPAEVASRNGLGLHHVATTVGPRVARVYYSGGAVVETVR